MNFLAMTPVQSCMIAIYARIVKICSIGLSYLMMGWCWSLWWLDWVKINKMLLGLISIRQNLQVKEESSAKFISQMSTFIRDWGLTFLLQFNGTCGSSSEYVLFKLFFHHSECKMQEVFYWEQLIFQNQYRFTWMRLPSPILMKRSKTWVLCPSCTSLSSALLSWIVPIFHLVNWSFSLLSDAEPKQ